MITSGFIVLLATILPDLPPPAPQPPVVPGLSSKHPLTQPQVGHLLLGELRCLACHTHGAESVAPERTAPDLTDVGARVAPEYLQRLIASPSAAHPGSTMPDLLAGETEEKRTRIAEAITHFLVARSPGKFHHELAVDREAAAGKTLFHSIGCIACHSPRDSAGKETTPQGAVHLAHVPDKYSLPALRDFLFQPLRVRPSGRMPDMKLNPAEARALASYLLGKSATTAKALAPEERLVALGKTYFQQLNCAACHKLDDMRPAPAIGDLGRADLTRGCLARTPGKSPRFNLDDAQTRAIRAALADRSGPASDKTRLAVTLTAFNCISCHVRDDYGGVSAEHNLLFQTDEKELGDEGRIPPPLTLVGAKLQAVTMKKVLYDGDSVRSYMATRMPQFGEANLRHLPDLFSRLDSVKNIEFSLPNPETNNEKVRQREREMRAGGRELVGDRGLYCIACHSVNGKTPNKKGIDLMTFPQRLKPSWFYHFLRDPSAFRPRTVMPTAWPEGKAVQTTILHGDTDRQIEAIWYYLTLGTSAPNPSGVQPVQTRLTVTDATRVYRGRSSVAGYRGIAVGFPEQLNYAFNAETGTLSALWRGNFLRVDRSGQGSGGFNPDSRFVALAQDVSFFALPDEQTPWPLRPVMNKEVRVNPDPLYPKNRGYQFRGYYLDDRLIPTFMYQSGMLDIEDRSIPHTAKKPGGLVRTLTFDAPAQQTIWFRALTGKIETESKQQFKTGELRLTIPAVRTLLRPAGKDKNVTELLLQLDIPKGKSTRTLTYELLQ